MRLRAGALLDATWDEPMTGGLRQGARTGTQIRMAIYSVLVREASTGWYREPIRPSEEPRLSQIDRKPDDSGPVD